MQPNDVTGNLGLHPTLQMQRWVNFRQRWVLSVAVQQLLMKWHNRQFHMNLGKLQELTRQGHLPKAIANCEHPICRSCQLGKAHRRPVASASKANPIDSGDLQPGDCVSVDQMDSSDPGHVDTYSGKLTSAHYHAASLYTDHASQFM